MKTAMATVASLLCLAASAIAAEFVDIQSVQKTRVTGWVFDKGAGTRTVQAVEVKFKIGEKGNVDVPVMFAYLYDKKKNQVAKLDKFLLKTGTRYQEKFDHVFKGRKTQLVAFVYPNELRFKYILVVMGKPGAFSVQTWPREARSQDFAFDEKSNL